MSKVIFVRFWLFYDASSPNMVMSRDPRSSFLFCPNSKFNIRKGHKISSVKPLYLEVISQKPHGGWTPSSAFRVMSAPTQK